MSQTASRSRDALYTLKDAPAVLNWEDCSVEHSEETFLGNLSNTSILITHNLQDDTATFRVSVPFLSSRKDEPFLYIFINPTCIKSLRRHSCENALPELVCKSPLGRLPHHDIVGFNLDLDASPTIVGPAGLQTLSPKGRLPGNILASLRSLSRARSVDIFIRQDEALRSKLLELGESIARGKLQACTKYSNLRRLYGGTGGACVNGLLGPFRYRPATRPQTTPGPSALDESEQAEPGACTEPPPAYEPSSETPPPVLKSMKRRISPTHQTPSSKRLLTYDIKSPVSTNTDIASLRLELETLRRQLYWQTATTAGTPTEDGTILDRLDAFETRLTALEKRDFSTQQLEDALLPKLVPRIAEQILPQVFKGRLAAADQHENSLLTKLVPRLLEQLTPLILSQLTPHLDTYLKNSVFERVTEDVEDAMTEHRDDIEAKMYEIKDDIELSVESKIESAVGSELHDVVAAQLPEVVEEILASARVSLEIPR